jgi:hypothetical protein
MAIDSIFNVIRWQSIPKWLLIPFSICLDGGWFHFQSDLMAIDSIFNLYFDGDRSIHSSIPYQPLSNPHLHLPSHPASLMHAHAYMHTRRKHLSAMPFCSNCLPICMCCSCTASISIYPQWWCCWERQRENTGFFFFLFLLFPWLTESLLPFFFPSSSFCFHFSRVLNPLPCWNLARFYTVQVSEL